MIDCCFYHRLNGSDGGMTTKARFFNRWSRWWGGFKHAFFFFYRPSQNPRTEADSKKSAGIFSFLFLTEEMQIEVKIPDTAMSVKRFQLRMLLFFFLLLLLLFGFIFLPKLLRFLLLSMSARHNKKKWEGPTAFGGLVGLDAGPTQPYTVVRV